MEEELQNTRESMELAEARFLWDEYRYRHEHCWNLVFKITAAVVGILIIPYIRPDITRSVGRLILALPLTAIGLVVFSFFRLNRELDVLARVKKVHRKRQGKTYPDIGADEHESTFKLHVQWYLVTLAGLAVVEIIALLASVPAFPAVSSLHI
jgi:hypothetical protein